MVNGNGFILVEAIETHNHGQYASNNLASKIILHTPGGILDKILFWPSQTHHDRAKIKSRFGIGIGIEIQDYCLTVSSCSHYF